MSVCKSIRVRDQNPKLRADTDSAGDWSRDRALPRPKSQLTTVNPGPGNLGCGFEKSEPDGKFGIELGMQARNSSFLNPSSST